MLLQVNLENIGAEDIVDGNPRLILGLIWTIILRSQYIATEFKLKVTDRHFNVSIVCISSKILYGGFNSRR